MIISFPHLTRQSQCIRIFKVKKSEQVTAALLSVAASCEIGKICRDDIDDELLIKSCLPN